MITLNQFGFTNAASGTLGLPVAAGDAIVVAISVPTSGATVSGITDSSGNTYLQAVTANITFTTPTNMTAYIFYAVNVAASASLTITPTISAGTPQFWTYELTGVNALDHVGSLSQQGGAHSYVGPTLNASGTDFFVELFLFGQGGGVLSVTPGPPWVQDAHGLEVGGACHIVSGTGSQTPTLTQTGFSAWANVAACFTQATTVTTTAMASNLNPSLLGQLVTFTATVSGPGGLGSPTGTVTFNIDGSNVATVNVTPVSAGVSQAQYSTSSLAIGTHPVYGVYTGDTNYSGNVSNTVNQVVQPSITPTSSTAIASSLNPSILGQLVVFTATVDGFNGGTFPTGTVTFNIDGSNIATVAVSGVNSSQSQAQYGTSILTVGTHPVFASYSGDSEYPPSTSATLLQVVQAPVSTPTPSNANDFGNSTADVIWWHTGFTGYDEETLGNEGLINTGGTPNIPWLLGLSVSMGNAMTEAIAKQAIIYQEPEAGWDGGGGGNEAGDSQIGAGGSSGGLIVGW